MSNRKIKAPTPHTIRLCGLQEASGLLASVLQTNISKQVVRNWRMRDPDFPKPYQELACGPVWDETVIEAYGQRRAVKIPPQEAQQAA